MFHHILFATDGSFTAERAADYAASLAVRFHAKVTVLHAFIAVASPSPAYEFPNVGGVATRADAESLAERVAEQMRKHGVEEVQSRVLQGHPAHAILGVAEMLKPDVIVLGARGVSTWKGQLLGSISMAVVQRAEAPVLVVR